MAYQNNIPQANDLISQSQTQILENFSQLDIQYGSSGDHVEFTSASNNGKHKRSIYIEQGADPATAANEMGVYTKDTAGNTELYVRRETNGSVIQLTKGTVNITGSATVPPAKGHSFLPGGMIIQWGSVAATPGGTAFTFDVVFSSIFSITGSIQAGGAQAFAFSGIGGAGGTAYSAAGTQTVNYIAIGT